MKYQKTSRIARLKRLGVNLVLTAGAILSSLLLLEGGVRVFTPQNLYPVSYAEDPLMGTRYKPNLKGFVNTHEYHTRIETNSRGFRDVEHAFPKPPGTLRILAIGDSFTAGDGVELPQVYHKVLEARLNGSRPDVQFEAINGGVSGWGPANGLAFLLTEGVKYSPDILIVQVFMDHYERALGSGLFRLSEEGSLVRVLASRSETSEVSGLARKIPFYGYLAENSHLLNLVRQEVARALWRRSHAEVIQQITSLDTGNDEAPFKLTLAIFEEFNTYAQKAEIPWVLVIVAPWKQVVSEPRSPREGNFYKVILAWAQRNGITVIDTVEAFRAQPDPLALYYIEDGHFRIKGHELLAELLYREMTSGKLRLGKTPP